MGPRASGALAPSGRATPRSTSVRARWMADRTRCATPAANCRRTPPVPAPSTASWWTSPTPDSFLAVQNIGNSGVPGSPHYRDQFEPWLRGEYHVVHLRRERRRGRLREQHGHPAELGHHVRTRRAPHRHGRSKGSQLAALRRLLRGALSTADTDRSAEERSWSEPQWPHIQTATHRYS